MIKLWNHFKNIGSEIEEKGMEHFKCRHYELFKTPKNYYFQTRNEKFTEISYQFNLLCFK
jgi:hypothetical protein